MKKSHSARASLKLIAAVSVSLLLLSAAGCASGPKKPDKITLELLNSPKDVLFQKGKALLERKKFDEGRKYLNFVFETYPNDAEGRQALILVADSYFRQGGSTGYTEARFRYRDYLNRYPGAPQRDYARYQFAVCYDKEHEKSDRDQTSTREAGAHPPADRRPRGPRVPRRLFLHPEGLPGRRPRAFHLHRAAVSRIWRTGQALLL